MFVLFYIVNLYICDLFSSYCLYDTLMGKWNVCIYVCMYVCMWTVATGGCFPGDKLYRAIVDE